MDEKDVLNNEYYLLNKNMMRLVALWPYQSRWKKIFIRSTLVLIVTSVLFPIIIRLVEEFQEENSNQVVILENISATLLVFGMTGNYVVNIFIEDKLQYIYEQMTRDWQQIKITGEKDALQQQAKVGYYLSLAYTIILCLMLPVYLSAQAVTPAVLNVLLPRNESRPLLLCYYGEYYVDQQKYFHYLFLHTTSVGCAMMCIAVATVTTYVTCTQHVLGLFDVIGYRLNKVCEITENSLRCSVENAEQEINKYILLSIQMHKKSIKFSSLIQENCNALFFVLVGFLILFIGFVTYDLVMSFNNIFNFMRLFSILFLNIAYLFYLCWPGQKIINCSTELSNKIYACGWYEFPMKSRFMIYFMLIRCNTSCKLTAGPLLILNFENCLLVLKAALSYFMAALSIN